MSETPQETQELEPEGEPDAETPEAPVEPAEGDELEGEDEEPAEPLEGDDGEQGEPEGEPEPEGLSAEEVDRIIGKIERSGETWTKRALELAEEAEQQIVRCPVCLASVPGFIFHPQVVPLSESQTEGAKALLGLSSGPAYKQAPTAQPCPTCDGLGKVRTGSRVDGKDLTTCPECRGLGFVGELANLTPAQAAGEEPVPLELAPSPDVYRADEDEWGTPRGHPDFGKMPHHREAGWQESRDAYRRSVGLAEVA